MTTYFVQKDGNDNNPSGPFLTIQKAASKATAGDIVSVKTGTYTEIIQPANSGTIGKNITFQNYGNDVVILKAPIKQYMAYNISHIDQGHSFTTYHHRGIFEIVNKQYIIIKGFTFTTAFTGTRTEDMYPIYSISIGRSSGYITVTENKFDDIDNAAIVAGSWSINGNLVNKKCWNINFTHNYIDKTFIGPGDGYGECISFDGVDYANISYNTITNELDGIGIDLKEGCTNGVVSYNSISNVHNKDQYSNYFSQGIYIDGYEGGCSNINVFGNRLNATKGIDIGAEVGGLVTNVNIYNNIISNSYYGIYVVSSSYGGIPRFNNLKFINNTVFNSISLMFWMPISDTNNQNFTIRNNVAFGGTKPLLNNCAKDGNLNYMYAICIASGHTIDTNTWNLGITDPKFVNAAGKDFHLQPTSPCVDKGNLIGAPTIDADGVTRIGNPDLGAYEFTCPQLTCTLQV